MRLKPKVFHEICSRKVRDTFTKIPRRINLNNSRLFKIPFSPFLKFSLIGGLFCYLIFSSALAPAGNDQLLHAANDEERAALEKQLGELEAQMENYQSTIDKYKSEGRDLQSEISVLNARINKLNLQIKSITVSLNKINQEIGTNEKQIKGTESEIGQNKNVLERSLQNIYTNENLSLAEILLRNPRLSDFFGEVSDLMAVQDSLRAAFEKLSQLHEELISQKEALAIKKNDNEQLKVYQDAQRASINSVKSEKADILNITKGNEAKYQALLKETQKTAAQIRSRIFELLGGGELTFEDAYKFAKFAEQATGIRAALVLAVLDRESALGQNVGRCTYQKSMHPTRDIPIFLSLLSELNISPDSVTVSCANRDGMYGGAMGPAQFIPSTWNLYKGKIAEITGSNPPSPWRNSDAFTATSLYLKDSIRGCVSVYSKKLDQERCAAAKYYAGGRWRTYLWTYGDRVVTQAEKFQKDIDILNS
ncbi:MAG: lytic murein transglycosylase [Patescibacteria group bacterium]